MYVQARFNFCDCNFYLEYASITSRRTASELRKLFNIM